MREPGCCDFDSMQGRAANDNADAGWSEPLTAALHLFARAGVAAPQVALDRARAAEAAADTATASDWQEVGRMFSSSAMVRRKKWRRSRSGGLTPLS